MSNPPYGSAPGGQWPQPGPPAGQPPAWSAAPPKQSRGPIIISLLVALIAVVVAIGAWFKPPAESSAPENSTPKYSDEQVAAAKKTMCSAYDKVYAALSGAGGQSSNDPNVQLTIAVNTRLAAHVNSEYIRQSLIQNPATPSDLAESFGKMASAYDDIVLAQLAGAQSADLEPFNTKLDAAASDVTKACK